METSIVPGAGADRAEGATGCRQHRKILFERGLEVKTNPTTGAKCLWIPPKNRNEIKPKGYPVPGLRIFHVGSLIKFEYLTSECIDASDCVDAQCRAGWDDDGYGFDGLEIGIMPDGSHRATWTCGVSCD